MGLLLDQFNRPTASDGVLDAERDRRMPDVGKNLPSAVADVQVPFPADWETALRAVNPKTDLHSWLLPYYYRLQDRWVLYDCVPRALIREDQLQAPGLTGRELLHALEGTAPRDLPHSLTTPFVSDVQHEMYRLHRVYARPYWVLQGDRGGHQVAYSPDQRNFLTECGLPDRPPAIGSLPACPFDERVIGQLQRLNRLYALNGSLDRLRASGSSDAAEVQRAIQDREVREVSLAMLEQQLGDLVEMVHTLGGRKDTSDMVISATGQAAKASEALAAYIETGDFIM